ncbi:MAG: retroviral-like aspartic protease family protein [Firmicutes bacterium]|nr:retroviral-like aspartic protease family protein [Bacillota bacterium]
MKLLLSLPLYFKHTMKVKCFLYSDNPSNKSWKEIEYIPLRLLIDTGASQTAITKNILIKMGYTNFKKSNVKKITATGLATFETTNVARLSIAKEYAFSNLEVEVLDWSNTALHGVIGMDVLSQFYIYSDKKTFTIQSQPIILNETEKDQEISRLTEQNAILENRIKQLENNLSA